MTALPTLDPRVNAFRPDLADVALRPFIEAERFVEPSLYQCVRGVVPLFEKPDSASRRVSEIRYGEFVDVVELRDDGFAWVQNRNDRYVGYMDSEGTLSQTIAAMMNRVNLRQTFVYDAPDLKAPVLDRLTLGSFVSLDGESGDFYQLASGGFVFKKHVAPADEVLCPDYVFTAGQLLNVPFLWGGRTPLGLDCSGLVQLALDIAGIDSPRDKDQQQALFGRPLQRHWRDIAWKRGDIVFFDDHVGIMAGGEHLIHASDTLMQVAVEPLDQVVTSKRKIAALGRP